MSTQQPNTTTGQVAQVVQVQTIDPYTLFPSPTNNFLMQSVGTAEELKCLFCFPIESTFQVLRVCLGILIALSGIGILVLTIDIFGGDENYGIPAGSIWILTVSLMVGYLILKIYTFYRCHQFIQRYGTGTVEFHDTGRKFFYAFGADVVCSLVIAVSWNILFFAVCGDYGVCEIFTDLNFSPFLFVMTWFVAFPFSFYIIFGVIGLAQLSTYFRFIGYSQYSSTNNIQWFLFNHNINQDPQCKGCFGCNGCDPKCGIIAIGVVNFIFFLIGFIIILQILGSIDFTDDSVEIWWWILVAAYFWFLLITLLFLVAAVSSWAFGCCSNTAAAFHRMAIFAYLSNLALSFTCFIIVFYGTLIAFTFGQAGAGIAWLLIGGFISFLPFHCAQLIDASCLLTNKQASGKQSGVQMVQAPGGAAEGNVPGANTTQPGAAAF